MIEQRHIEHVRLPLAICDGDAGGPMESLFERFFEACKVPFDKCYSLYKNPVDLSIYSTIAFFTTNSHATEVKKIFDFDMSNLRTVIVIGDYAYDLAKPVCESKGILLLRFDTLPHVFHEGNVLCEEEDL